ncbi:MAG: HAMP domain-containing sensor histidine kinase [Bacillota bacterium]|nr:HAMP domain-containing sensor histidine kinase [Bacillota bacterium]
MRSFRFKSLTMRIWATFTITILIIICSISFLYLGAFRRFDENAKMQDLKVVHDTLLKSDNFNQSFNRFDELKNLRGSDYFILNVDENNKTNIININNRKGMPPIPPKFGPNDKDIRLWMASFIKDNSIYEKEFTESYQNMKFLFIVSPIKYGDSGKYYLISYLQYREDNSLLYTVMIIGVVFIFIGFLTAKLVANYISKPLKELEDYTIRIAHKDWKDPMQVKSSDEIGRLVAAMNRMQKELQHADEEEKMFLQSISHDLKTPVMVIMSHAEAIIDGVYIESVEKTAEIIRDEASSLEKKVKQILYLNTLDYVLENNNEKEEVNLQDLLLYIISRLEVVNSKIEWDLAIDEFSINGNIEKIQVAIENILENGLRYAEEKIRVTLKEEDSFAVLEIYNDGPNIKETHIDHIFDNMYKDKTGNFGLGLAISKKIISFYDGEIYAVNRNKGVSFIIKFPV